jgi:hypothetical protein
MAHPQTVRLVTIRAGIPPTYEPHPDHYAKWNQPLAEEMARTISQTEQCVVVVQDMTTHEYEYVAFCGRSL